MSAGARDGITFAIHPSAAPVSGPRRAELLARPAFGQIFTDHMVTIEWDEGVGWHDAQLRPYGPFSMDPASAVFHYAQEIFEGLKAYRQVGGAVVMFRPTANAARFNRSAARMGMPELPEDAFVQALELLVTQDRDWVPGADAPGGEESLYLRPFMIATHVGLNVSKPATSYTFAVIASPAGTYFARGVQPVSVWLADSYTRAAPGGTGAAKTGGNYAGAFAGQLEAPPAGARLRAGGLARRDRAPVGRGNGRHEPVLRPRFRAERPDHDTRTDRDAAPRYHQGLAADPGSRPRDTRGGGRDLGRAVASRLRFGPDH
jgi:branched-chain amino acid aminotransferase